jgi:hypothetical protein
MSESIYGSTTRTVTSWPASYPRTPTPPRTSAAVIHTSTTIASAHDARLLAILDAPTTGEPALVAFARKERELGAAFAALPILDQRALATRLAKPRAGDVLADKFGRLTAERRTRLINFLNDARRRAAMSKAGR